MFPPVYLNTIYSTITFLGIICTLVPLRWHWQAWNTGTCLFMIVHSLMGLIYFINSIVWKGNAINFAPVYCDITTAFQVAGLFSYSSSFLVVNRRLYLISTAKVVRVTKTDKRRAVCVDLAIGITLPVLAVIFHYIGQGHRFDILEDIGCVITLYLTSLSFVLYYVYPFLIVLVSAVYSFLAVRSFLRIRRNFAELSSHNFNLTSSRYLRIIALSIFTIVVDFSFRLYVMITTVQAGGIHPWLGWEDTHLDFSRVTQIPAVFWRSNPIVEVSWEINRWVIPFLAFAFFGFFGFADEAVKNYHSAINVVTGTLGIRKTSTTSSIFSSWRAKESSLSSNNTASVVAMSVDREKQNSTASFTDMSFTDTISLHSEKEGVESSAEKGERTAVPLAYDELSFCDVGGALGDAKLKS